MSGRIKFVVIGAGHIGKRHAAVIQNNIEGELVAIVDIDSTLEEEITKQFKVPFYRSFELFLQSGIRADIANICTPNHQHAPHSTLALENGLHVVCEKPMALSVEDCKKVIAKAEEVNKEVFCVMQNRYSPSAIWLKEMLSNDRLGKINMVLVNCFWNRGEAYYNSSSWRGLKDQDGGTLFTQFSHFIDTLYWLMGDITNVQSKIKNFNHGELIEFEDTGVITFDFTSGGFGCLNYSTSAWEKNFESSITILGEKGSVKVGGQYMNCVEYCHVQNYEMPELEDCLPPNDYGHYKGSAANHHFVIENVIQTLIGKTKVATSALEGMKVVDIIERIYQSSRCELVFTK